MDGVEVINDEILVKTRKYKVHKMDINLSDSMSWYISIPFGSWKSSIKIRHYFELLNK